MSVLKKYFDGSINQSSPVQKDYARIVRHDENGEEFITWEAVDYKSLQKSHGTVDFWSLEAMLKAGINPNMPIHTGVSTRLEGISQVEAAAAVADSILAEDNKE